MSRVIDAVGMVSCVLLCGLVIQVAVQEVVIFHLQGRPVIGDTRISVDEVRGYVYLATREGHLWDLLERVQ